MASEWSPADWTEVGTIGGVLPNGGDLEVHARRDGLVVLDLDGEEIELSPAERDNLREFLDRAAMTGQPAEPPAPAEVMRRAAARLREASANATPPPWRVSFLDGTVPVVDGPGRADDHMVAEMRRCDDPGHQDRPKADATLIVLLRNSAEALAGWLELEARRADEETRVTVSGRSCRICVGEHCGCWDGALTVAREILGEG